MENKLKNIQRTEEVQDIIERMPAAFGFRITIVVMIIVVSFLLFGWIIKYPDVVAGSIVINASSSPVKLVSNTNGKVMLKGLRNYSVVKEGDYIAVIKNSADPKDVLFIMDKLKKINFSKDLHSSVLNSFPRNPILGELNLKYFTFLNAFFKSVQEKESNLYSKQNDLLISMANDYKGIIEITDKRLKMSESSLDLVKKSYQRDSILSAKKVLAESDNDRSNMSLISAKDALQAMLKDITLTKSQLAQTENQLQQNQMQKILKEKQLEIDLVTAYTELESAIESWEQKYVFKAPIAGKVQFTKFWTENQAIQAGEDSFTIVPQESDIVGQMTLPASGAGKVRIGQEVLIKLADYPYLEYGNVKGIVKSISLLTNPLKIQNNEIETYLVNVNLPGGLKTNYGSQLPFRFEIKGSGEIITSPRRLIERLFDNLRYKLKE
ncbi:HlyD family secretion protein [Pedobacter terrae]|uniref:HlyD family secretion protein n=1 Tax=Pedobacter terrae TaxID=405671 RepID=A0A1G7NZG6_9SPHI|nr:HlyD family efflux transporter periplasmic adaptor subunit [Pedobacter terrae]SDF79381.1 HlyD family secretion protein [Pedobacter terrae]